jgi:hypothetical protein
MVGEDAHWCGGPTALSLLGGVSSSGDFGVGLCGQRDCLLGGEWDWEGGGRFPPLCLACLDLVSDAGRSEERGSRSTHRLDSSSLQQHSAQAVERPRGEIGWSGLEWAAGGRFAVRGWLDVACWRFRAGLADERRQLPQPSCLRIEAPGPPGPLPKNGPPK